MPIRAHVIPRLLTRHDIVKIQKSIDEAPNYGARVANALSRTIRAIHGLADFHKALKLEDIEVYIGKAEDSPTAIFKRWLAHNKSKKHRFGMVLFRCSQTRAKVLEKVGIRVFDALTAKNRLCVGKANIAKGSQGRDATAPNCVVYLTWTVMDTPSPFTKPNKKIIQDVAATVAAAMKDSVTAAQISTGLRPIKRLTQKESVKIEHFRT